MKTPLAWRNLTNHKGRLALSIAGIAGVVLLMFMQTGFLNAGFDTSLILYRNFQADLVMISSARTVESPKRFARGRLYETRSCPSVASVIPVYLRRGKWKSAEVGASPSIQVLGFDTRKQALSVPFTMEQDKLSTPGTVCFDSLSRNVYGGPTTGSIVEIGGRNVEIVGLFAMGASLESDGNLVMDESTYFSVFGGPEGDDPSTVDFGLIQLHPGADPQAALAQIRQNLAGDVIVMTRDDYVASIKRYMESNSTVTFLFNLGVFVGFVIGMIVCYQVLFTDISANLMPFATLKAMGYPNAYLVKVVLQQAALLGLMGFACGLVGTFFLYRGLQARTGLVMFLTVPRAASILILTLAMCMVAGFFAVKKAIKADPADCF